MKLTHIRVKDFRSFAGRHAFDVSEGVNYFVGPNNCGKSNLVAALELALDPDAAFVPHRDRPATSLGGRPPKTRITLTFKFGKTPPELTLGRRAQEYELELQGSRAAGQNRTYAAGGEIKLVTSFGAEGDRQTSFQALGMGATSVTAESETHKRLLSQFRSVVRFAVVHSGEDLESLLSGKFREILSLVIKDHLNEQVRETERGRQGYVEAMRDTLLEPLRTRINDRVAELFPEITLASLEPAVPTVGDTLSSVGIQLSDLATTGLKGKGTGVRGAVLISMLQYLAEQSRRSLVLAVEEPEAFLHPGAQEIIARQLEELADRQEVSLLVTTHSPYVITHNPDASITELGKRPQDGVTRLVDSARGSEDRAERLGSLYRDPGLSRIIERSLQIPTGARFVLVTEGYTDGEIIRAACAVAGRSELFEHVHVMPSNGASKLVPQAVLAEAATDLPVIVLLDGDEHGKAAKDKLNSFNWGRGRQILCLDSWPRKCTKHPTTEIEDLLPQDVVQGVVDKLGLTVAVDGTVKCEEAWHYRVSDEFKVEVIRRLPGLLKGKDVGELIWLAESLNKLAQVAINHKASTAAHRAAAGSSSS